MKNTLEIREEALVAQMTGKMSRTEYEDVAREYGFEPLTDRQIAVLDPGLWMTGIMAPGITEERLGELLADAFAQLETHGVWEHILAVVDRVEDPAIVAAVLFTENRRVGLCYEILEGVLSVEDAKAPLGMDALDVAAEVVWVCKVAALE